LLVRREEAIDGHLLLENVIFRRVVEERCRFGFVGEKFAVGDTTPVNGISLLRRYLLVEENTLP
jgi:hypothetical protein